MGMDVRVPIRVWFDSIQVSGFRNLKCQPHSGFIDVGKGLVQIFADSVQVRIIHLIFLKKILIHIYFNFSKLK